ncbi:MAG: L-aspartate oxidase [Candidatus Dadabacteria bacterium]|nr:L-aspartate oxidase [Candidatus Dadabacteria bacterium]MYC40882.1 L-aspartate oxidase [Candidatus Dadabacteria bacterium]
MSVEIIDVECDFLVVGGGLAGLYAAVCASSLGRCVVVTKQTLVQSNSYWAQGGIAAAVDPEDSPVFHKEDTVAAGRGLCDARAVEILVEEGRERVADLINLGMKFDSDDSGLLLGLEGGHSKRRVLHAGGDSTGKEMIDFLISYVSSSESVTILELVTVTDIISDGERCYGVWGYDEGKKSYVRIASPSTILATGGASALYRRTTNPEGASGEGISLAWRAGAEISDMEFVQFHPTVFSGPKGEAFLLTEAIRGEGAYLLNARGERFMERYSSLLELAPRDVVSKAIHGEMRSCEEDYVCLDLSHMDPEFVRKRFSNIEKLCRNSGFDLARDRIPVAPAAHYTIGGVRTGLMGETSIEGLYACGEVSNTGVHGANRLASNSLLECMVFAKRCIDGAARAGRPGGVGGDFEGFMLADTRGADTEFFNEARDAIIGGMSTHLGIVREREGIERFIARLEEISSASEDVTGWFGFKLGTMLDVCLLVARGALLRKESRGAHLRSDYPEEDTDYEKHLIFRKDLEVYGAD